MLGDFSSTKEKISTAMWVLSVALSKVYEAKMRGKIPVLDILVEAMKEDMAVAKMVPSGANLEMNVFVMLEVTLD